jgi:hypothetical protein
MRFQSTWEGLVAGGALDEGSHSPPWDELDEQTQAVIEEAADGALGVISQLVGKVKKGEPEQLFTVQVSGYVGEGDEDSTRTAVSVAIDETGSTTA